MTKIIQLGITLADETGRMPLPYCTWQFNFDFNDEKEKKEASSITMLLDSGIDFNLIKHHGINPTYFGEKMLKDNSKKMLFSSSSSCPPPLFLGGCSGGKSKKRKE